MAALAGGERSSWIRRFDWILAGASLALLFIGFASLYSLGHRHHDPYFRKQAAMAVIGLAPMLIFLLVDPRWWRKAMWPLYAVNVILLTAVLFIGSSANGAQRWIDLKFMQFQPSELAKILLVLTLSTFLASRQDQIHKFSTFFLSFVHVAVPAFLILKQPHYGGALVLIVIWISACIAGNVPLKFIFGSIIFLALFGLGATQIPGAMHDYHMKRIQALQQSDSQGASYQQDRAEVALGAGGLTGVGFRKGRQNLPEQENDFIFTVVGEEFGLAGCTAVLAIFGLLFFRMWQIMLAARDPYLRMLVAGVLGLLAFHTVVNVGMVVHLLPVVGLWLPFMSEGGTALWLCMACVGLVLAVRSKERPILF